MNQFDNDRNEEAMEERRLARRTCIKGIVAKAVTMLDEADRPTPPDSVEDGDSFRKMADWNIVFHKRLAKMVRNNTPHGDPAPAFASALLSTGEIVTSAANCPQNAIGGVLRQSQEKESAVWAVFLIAEAGFLRAGLVDGKPDPEDVSHGRTMVVMWCHRIDNKPQVAMEMMPYRLDENRLCFIDDDAERLDGAGIVSMADKLLPSVDFMMPVGLTPDQINAEGAATTKRLFSKGAEKIRAEARNMLKAADLLDREAKRVSESSNDGLDSATGDV